jgi:hypothetical protein
MHNKALTYILSGSMIGLSGFGYFLHANSLKPPVNRVSQPSYAANFADDAILVGASHNVFVGKVLEQTGSKKLGRNPETQFSVEVVANIKGNLEGVVTVDQFGGYENGILYSVDGGPSSLTYNKSEPYLLQAGSTYLLATRYNDKENWYTLNSFSTARKLLSQDTSLNKGQLKALAESDGRFQHLASVYPTEVVMSADINAHNVQNAYASRRFDHAGALIDDTVELHNQLKASTSPTSGNTSANAPADNSAASSPDPSDAPTTDVASPTPSTDVTTPTAAPAPDSDAPTPSDNPVPATS